MSMRIIGDCSQPIASLTKLAVGYAPAVVAAERREMESAVKEVQAEIEVRTGNLRATGRVERGDAAAAGIEFVAAFGGKVGIDRYVDYAGLHEAYKPHLGPVMERRSRVFTAVMVAAFEGMSVL